MRWVALLACLAGCAARAPGPAPAPAPAAAEPAPATPATVTPGLHVHLAAPPGACPCSRPEPFAEEGTLGEVLAALGRHARVPVVVDPRVAGERVVFRWCELGARDAIDTVAHGTRCDVEELPGGVLLVTRHQRVTLRLDGGDARAALLEVGRQAGRQVVVLPGAEGPVSADLRDLTFEDALTLVAASADLQVAHGDGYALVGPDPLPPVAPPGRPFVEWWREPRLDVHVEDQPLVDVLDAIGRVVGQAMISEPEPRVSLDVTGAPWGVLVGLLARLAGCEVERPHGAFLVVPPRPNAVRAVGAPAATLLLLLAGRARVDVTVGPGVEGPMDLELRGVGFQDAVRLAAWTHGFEVRELEVREHGPPALEITAHRDRRAPAPPAPRAGPVPPVTATLLPGPEGAPVAIVGGHVLLEGEPVLDAEGRPLDGLTVSVIEDGRVRFRCGDEELTRAVGE